MMFARFTPSRAHRLMWALPLLAGLTATETSWAESESPPSAAATPQLVVVGNSLTEHGPAPSIHWGGHWGMAASTADKDYVSQLLTLLPKAAGQAKWRVKRVSAGALEATAGVYTAPVEVVAMARQSRLVILQAGDNVDPTKVPLPEFERNYTRLAGELRPQHGSLICVSTWWPNPQKDRIIRAACSKSNGTFVDISDIARTPGNVARTERKFQNDGVASHPGDAGMQAIAQRIHQRMSDPRPLQP